MAWKELFGTDIGLLSLFTIGFMIVMAIYLGVYFKKEADKDAKQAKQAK
jgi:hypothetical protein